MGGHVSQPTQTLLIPRYGNIRAQTRDCSAVAEATPHSGGGPLRTDAYHSHPRPARAIDQRVRTDFVVNVRDVDLRRRQPLQGLGYIAGPDAPRGTVSAFHQMTHIVVAPGWPASLRSWDSKARIDHTGDRRCRSRNTIGAIWWNSETVPHGASGPAIYPRPCSDCRQRRSTSQTSTTKSVCTC